MPATLESARLHVIVGTSLVLRDERLAELIASWSGPLKRVSEPPDLERILLDLDTPSLFEAPACWLVRADGRYLRKHAETLARACQPGGGACLVLITAGVDKAGKSGDPLAALVKKLRAAEAWHEVVQPDGKEIAAWLCSRLTALPQGVEHPRQVADALLEHIGEDIDTLVAAVKALAIFAGEGAVTPAAVEALVVGTAARPIWEFTGAALEGNAKRAIELMHAGEGLEPQRALSALVSEVRKLIACCATADDALAARWSGSRGRPNLYYARQRARNLGRPCLQRLLHGCQLTQRQLRQGGVDLELAVEMLVLHAQRIIRPAGR
jgi:DNA polymerase III delta subunit